MRDLGLSLLATAERNGGALAIIDGDLRLTYGEWLDRVLRLVDEEQVAGGGDDVLATVGHDRHEDFVVDRRHERVVFTG